MFEQDMNLLLNQVTDFNKLFTVENGQHPYCSKTIYQKELI